jgi:predicted transposase/invertase (TIGR01784 family)
MKPFALKLIFCYSLPVAKICRFLQRTPAAPRHAKNLFTARRSGFFFSMIKTGTGAGRFINPLTDVGFKRIFGQEDTKDLLSDFLNSLFDTKEGERITVESYIDKEQIPDDTESGRVIIFDVYCRTEDGRRFIVEMQNGRSENFRDRCLFYATRALGSKGVKGDEWNYALEPLCLIALMNFDAKFAGDRFMSCYSVRGDERGDLLSDKLRFVFLQLTKFKKRSPEECATNFERWIYLLKHMPEMKEMLWEQSNPAFGRLASVADLDKMSESERVAYDRSLKRMYDYSSVLRETERESHEEGREEGHEEGVEDGRKKERLRIARNMLAKGKSEEEIREMIGLTDEELAEARIKQ